MGQTKFYWESCPWGKMSWGELSMGRVVHGASCPWSEISLWWVVHGASCLWGEITAGQNIMGRVSIGLVVRGASFDGGPVVRDSSDR